MHKKKNTKRTVRSAPTKYVSSVTMVISHQGEMSTCTLLFDDFTTKELFDSGFCGPVQLKGMDDDLELVCDFAHGQRENAVNGFVFSLTDRSGKPSPAVVTKFRYHVIEKPSRNNTHQHHTHKS